MKHHQSYRGKGIAGIRYELHHQLWHTWWLAVLIFLTPLRFLHPPSKVLSRYFLPPLIQEFQALFKSPGYSCQLHIYNCLNCNFRINLRAFWQVNRKPMFGTTKFWIFMIFHRFHISNCPWLDDNSVVC